MSQRNVDPNGIPGCQLDIYDETGDYAFDGGDSLAIVGTILTLGRVDDFFVSLFQKLDLFFGCPPVPRRHPDSSKWYGQFDRCSRDQLIPLLCALNKNYHSKVNGLFYAHKENWFLFAWNTKGNGHMDMPKKIPDLTGPDVWALWIRIFRPKWGKAILTVLDLSLVLGAISWKFRKDNVTRNYMLEVIVANEFSPTIMSRLAKKLTNWDDLIQRWETHCKTVGEYPTAQLFKGAL